jgi:hypothetical protein
MEFLLQGELHVLEAISFRNVHHLHSAVQQNGLDYLRTHSSRSNSCPGDFDENRTEYVAFSTLSSIEVE